MLSSFHRKELCIEMGEKNKRQIWTKAKSAILTLVCTRVLIGIIIAIAILLPFIFSAGLSGGFSGNYLFSSGAAGPYYGASPDAGILYAGMPAAKIPALFICAYASFVFIMIALFSLDFLLRNIRKELVFFRKNVRYLRIISWCCFAVAVIMLCGWPFISYVLIFVAAAAAFFGLLMRVVKNVIDAACEIKDENDFTI